MKKFINSTIAGYIALVFFSLLASWLITCGLIKIITLCFGLTFSWAIATGIWICLFLLKDIFGGSKK